jgi:hypothetical protein
VEADFIDLEGYQVSALPIVAIRLYAARGLWLDSAPDREARES